jgi:hypothetical protein
LVTSTSWRRPRLTTSCTSANSSSACAVNNNHRRPNDLVAPAVAVPVGKQVQRLRGGNSFITTDGGFGLVWCAGSGGSSAHQQHRPAPAEQQRAQLQ